jgi:hypothetical protein
VSESLASKMRGLLASDVYRVPPSTREQPFPPAEVMEPMRRIERLIRAVDDCSAAVRGLPLLNADRRRYIEIA